MHRDRSTVEGKHGPQYHRVFRKRTKHWDVVPTKSEKTFLYIPELLSLIFSYRFNLETPLHKHLSGKRTPSTTPVPAPATEDIVKSKKSRFSSSDTSNN